ncbi:MAG: response regulator [Sulfurimonadaceae bacterium]|nr:response regulator [Sulfurimonadaceae bacterium]
MSKVLQQKYPKSFELLQTCTPLQLDLYFYLDVDEELIGCNSAVLELLGYGSFEALQAHKATLPQLFVNDIHYPLPHVGEWLNRLEEASPLQVELRDREGKLRIYNVHARQIELDDAPLTLLILHETTLAERAKQAKNYYEMLTGELLSNVSRQFRTPLNGIVGFVGLLEHTELDAAQKEYAMHIRDAAENITGTVENLLEMVHADRGEIEAKIDVFDPQELHEAISARFSGLARSKGISLLYMFDPNLPKQMLGDSAKIARVMRNLTDNALKYTREGGQIFVEVLCRETDGNTALIEYAVSDTGCGINEKDLATILRPFASAHTNKEESIEGFGIGPHLSHKLLSVMDSKLRVASKVGKGSRFSFEVNHRVTEPALYELAEDLKAAVVVKQKAMTLQGKLLLDYLERFKIEAKEAEEIDKRLLGEADVLFVLNDDVKREKIELLKSNYDNLSLVAVLSPVREMELHGDTLGADYILTLPLLPEKIYEAVKIEPKRPVVEEEEFVAETKRATILIAEDNPINQKLLYTLLSKRKYEVMIANNGQEAVDAYLQAPYDLVLMDIDMPVMDGITATRLIHEIDKTENRGHTPVIALTAHALPGDKERIIEAGLDAHLAKPVDTTILLRLIKKFLKEPDDNAV